MLTIYTHKELIPKDLRVISKNDFYFQLNYPRYNLIADSNAVRIISEIDGAELTSSDRINSIFGGNVPVDLLSSGCKTVLNVYFHSLLGFKPVCFNTVECGNNAMLEVLRLTSGTLFMPRWPFDILNFDMDSEVITREGRHRVSSLFEYIDLRKEFG